MGGIFARGGWVAVVSAGGLALSGISDAAVQIGPAGELGDPNPRITLVGANGASIAKHGLGGDLEEYPANACDRIWPAALRTSTSARMVR